MLLIDNLGGGILSKTETVEILSFTITFFGFIFIFPGFILAIFSAFFGSATDNLSRNYKDIYTSVTNAVERQKRFTLVRRHARFTILTFYGVNLLSISPIIWACMFWSSHDDKINSSIAIASVTVYSIILLFQLLFLLNIRRQVRIAKHMD